SSYYWRKLYATNVSSTAVDATAYVSTSKLYIAGSQFVPGNYFKQSGNAFNATGTLGTTDNKNLTLITNGASRLTILNTGNVGIGTVNPTANLQVIGTAGANIFELKNSANNVAFSIDNSTLNAKFYAGTAANPGISANANPDTGIFWPPSAGSDQLAFTLNGSEKVRLNSLGYMGIGTNNPYLFMLTTAGSIGPSTTNSYDLGSSSYYWRKLYAKYASSTAIDALGYVSTSKLWLSSAGSASDPSIKLVNSNTGIWGSQTNGILFTYNGANKWGVGINNSAYASILPEATTLDLGSSSQYWRKLYARNVSSTAVDALGYVSTTNLYVAGSQFVPGNYFKQNGNAFNATGTLGLTDNQDLNIRTNNQNQLTILRGGNVGIGTVNPTSKLQVVGDITAQSIYPDTNGTRVFGDSTHQWSMAYTKFLATTGSGSGKTVFSMTSAGTYYGTVQVESVANGGTWSLGYQTAASSNLGNSVLTWNGQGKVGIGTTSPSNRLHVAGPGATGSSGNADLGFSVTSSATTLSWTMGADKNDGGKFKISSSTALGTNDRFVINGKGYVGIGTSSPQHVLDVRSDYLNIGNSGADGALGEVLGFTLATNPNDWKNSIYSSVSQGSGSGTLKFSMNVNNATTQLDVMTLKNSGKVGIGTIVPANRLTLTGSGASGSSGNADLGFNVTSSATTYSWAMGADKNDAGKFKISSSTALGTNDRLVINGKGYVGIGTATPYSNLTIGSSLNYTAIAPVFTALNPAVIAGTAGAYAYNSEFQSNVSGSKNRLQIAEYRRVAGADWQGTGFRIQTAVDNSFTDGSLAYA
ncbi:MAG: hypothetical protein PHW33_03505, partial [Candidatus Portnoybacteria bacterium]|nr:hypothetical protein [Candidatus Portnoybacteria bacterium]